MQVIEDFIDIHITSEKNELNTRYKKNKKNIFIKVFSLNKKYISFLRKIKNKILENDIIKSGISGPETNERGNINIKNLIIKSFILF